MITQEHTSRRWLKGALSQRARLVRWGRLAGLAGALVMFLLLFQPERDQRLVDALWLIALLLWASEIRSRAGGRLLDLELRRADVLPMVVILPIFAAAWVPFHDNWRWAYTDDSAGYLGFARDVAAVGLKQNLLSVHGVDNNFTVLNSLAFNVLMYIFGPGFFWHRMGHLLMSLLSLLAIYTYFNVVVGPLWSVVIVLATATNYVWLWFSFVSYPHINSFIFYFLPLTFAVLIFRRPERLGIWMLCGVTSGLALFFTQTAWSGVAAVGLVLVALALSTRRWAALVILGVSFALAATPLLLQIPGLINMAARQSRSPM